MLNINAFPISFNSQITNSVKQSTIQNNNKPTTGKLFQGFTNSLNNAAHNATTAQQQVNQGTQGLNIIA